MFRGIDMIGASKILDGSKVGLLCPGPGFLTLTYSISPSFNDNNANHGEILLQGVITPQVGPA